MTTEIDQSLAVHQLHEDIARLQNELALTRDQLASTEHAYGSFVPREFLHFLAVDNIRDVRLGMHTERMMTVLFSDIRNFTGLSESMTPQENFDFLNSYLSQMEPVIVPYRGLIDKFIGDAIMAMFPRCADDAVQGALAMLERLEKYNRGRARAGYVPIRTGIGVNTGIVMLGTVGGAGRMDTTVIGDSVNLASRLEGLTKVYNTPLLISEHTLHSLEDPTRYGIRFLGRSRVKGKHDAQAVYEVFDADPPQLRAAKRRTCKRFEEALAFFYTGSPAKAQSRLVRCLQEAPNDQPAQIYLERCDEFMRNNHVQGLDPIEFEQTWSDDYTSNIGDVDSRHRSLLTNMNNLTVAVRDGKNQHALTILTDIVADAKHHCTMEEDLMHEFSYPLKQVHAEQHQRFYQHLNTVGAQIAAETESPTCMAFRVRLLLIDWLINHSIKADRHFGQHLRSRSGARSASH